MQMYPHICKSIDADVHTYIHCITYKVTYKDVFVHLSENDMIVSGM